MAGWGHDSGLPPPTAVATEGALPDQILPEVWGKGRAGKVVSNGSGCPGREGSPEGLAALPALPPPACLLPSPSSNAAQCQPLPCYTEPCVAPLNRAQMFGKDSMLLYKVFRTGLYVPELICLLLLSLTVLPVCAHVQRLLCLCA